jgi:hypothetical protein
MLKRMAVLALLGVGLLSAKTYTLTVSRPMQAGTAQLKSGAYKINVNGSNAVLMDRKGNPIAVTAKVETTGHKYDWTEIYSRQTDRGRQLQWVELGGTKDRVVFQ